MRWMGVSSSRATGECKVPLRLKNQEAPFLIRSDSLSYRALTLCNHRGFFGCMELSLMLGSLSAPIGERSYLR